MPPPGDVSTNSASPEIVKLAARVTTMSGIPDTAITTPISVESATAIATTATAMPTHSPIPCPSIQSADRQFVKTSIAPTDRSMPPEITTTAWAMARKARLMVPGGDGADLEGAELRHLGRRQKHEHQQEQPRRP